MFLIPSRRSIKNPKSISGLNVWLSAGTGLYDATTGGASLAWGNNGAAVARWEDLSGNGYHFTQPTASARPTIYAPGGLVEGRRAVQFNGTSQFMREYSNMAGNLRNLKLYVFLVFQFTSYNANGYSNVISRNGGPTSGQSGQWHVRRWDLSPWYAGQKGALNFQVHTNGLYEGSQVANYSSTAYAYSVFSFPRTPEHSETSSISVNDSVLATQSITDDGAPNADTQHTLCIGARPYGSSYLVDNYAPVRISEVAIYLKTTNMLPREIQGLSKYFRKKWEI